MEFGIAFQNTCFETMTFPTETTKTTETTKLFRINFMHDFLCMAAMRLSHNRINLMHDFLCMAAMRLSHNQFLKLPHGGKEK